jgi:ABC-type sugar transport system permease subunit
MYIDSACPVALLFDSHCVLFAINKGYHKFSFFLLVFVMQSFVSFIVTSLILMNIYTCRFSLLSKICALVGSDPCVIFESPVRST